MQLAESGVTWSDSRLNAVDHQQCKKEAVGFLLPIYGIQLIRRTIEVFNPGFRKLHPGYLMDNVDIILSHHPFITGGLNIW